MDEDFHKRLVKQQSGHHTPLSSPTSSPFSRVSPGTSPLQPEKYGDRYIPARTPAKWRINFDLASERTFRFDKVKERLKKNQTRSPHNQSNQQGVNSRENGNIGTENENPVYKCLLKNELLGSEIDRIKDNFSQDQQIPGSPAEKNNVLKYSWRMRKLEGAESIVPYSLSPISAKSQKLLNSPRKPNRKIPKVPFKVLDAPELQDDFYLNLVDWSSTNVLSVGLGNCVYLWSACTSQVTRLCDLSVDHDSITSVCWSEKGRKVAVGTGKGYVQVWDVESSSKFVQMEGHTARVGALAWNGDQLSSGSRDRMILQRDIRSPSSSGPDRKLTGHRQEVCGLKWSPDHHYLASGGNDNKLLVWSANANANIQSVPNQTYSEHLAAVKAIAWSPHQHGLLASGGGTADRCMRFWNTLTQQPLQCIDTGSQVCNLAWSKHSSELVSTHGYSQNQILLWKYPSLTQVAKLTGHSFRVLYLATSPDGEAIVTGAGDETLRFWNVFSKSTARKESTSVLNLYTQIR